MDILLRKSARMNIFKDPLKPSHNFEKKRQKCMKFFFFFFFFFLICKNIYILKMCSILYKLRSELQLVAVLLLVCESYVS